jgi:hypothetical protein
MSLTMVSSAAEPAPPPKVESRQIEVAGQGSLAYKAPDGWTYSAPKLPSAKLPPTFKLSAPDGTGSLLVSVFWDDFGDHVLTDAELQNILKTSATRQYVNTSVEKKLDVQKLTQPGMHGWYAQFTDADLAGKEAPPGEFKVVTTGIFRTGNLWGNFTLLTNAKDDAVCKAGLKVIESFKKLERAL